MANLTKKARVLAAQKGARTKRRQSALKQALTIKSYLDKGLTVHEIALLTGDPLKVILDSLKLLTLSPNPVMKTVGIGANLASTGQDIVNALKTNKTSRLNATNIIKQKLPKGGLSDVLQQIVADPIGTHNAVVNGLNSIGHEITQPVEDLGTFVSQLLTGQ